MDFAVSTRSNDGARKSIPEGLRGRADASGTHIGMRRERARRWSVFFDLPSGQAASVKRSGRSGTAEGSKVGFFKGGSRSGIAPLRGKIVAQVNEELCRRQPHATTNAGNLRRRDGSYKVCGSADPGLSAAPLLEPRV